MKKALLIRHDPHQFIFQHFDPQWLKNLQIDDLQAERNDNRIHFFKNFANQSYNVIFVSAEVVQNITRSGISHLLRLLQDDGQLILQRNPNNEGIIHSTLIYADPIIYQTDKSSPHFVRCLKKAPNYALYDLIQQSASLQTQKQHAEALSFLQLALLAYPNELTSYQYLSLYYERLNFLDKIPELWFLATQSINNNMVEFLQLMSLLQIKDYANGFRLREQYARKYMSKQRRSHAFPPPNDEFDHQYWQGENLQGKTLVVWSEFGLGDEIMFAQLAHYLKHVAKVGKLIWVFQPAIVELMKTHPDIDEVINAKDAQDCLKNADYWTFPHALFAHIPLALNDMPKRMPYVFAQTDKLAHFAKRTQTDKPIKIGLAWRGDPTHENDRYRSVHNVNDLNCLLHISPKIQYFCVQKDLNENELAWLAANNIPHFSAELNSFADTAALISNMDYVMTVDTSVAHLAGALGVKTWVWLTYVYDWRWATPNMPNWWYPNVRKVHQGNPLANWQDTLPEWANALKGQF